MQLQVKVGERIMLAEKLPVAGELNVMDKVKDIRQVLVGWGSGQMTTWNIVPVDNTFVTGVPERSAPVTLDDEDAIIVWADIIRSLSARGLVTMAEAEIYTQIVQEAERIIEERRAQQQEEEEQEPEGEGEGNGEQL